MMSSKKKGKLGRCRPIHLLVWKRDCALSDAARLRVTGAVVTVIKEHPKEVMGVTFSPDGKTFASASEDALVRIFSAGTGIFVVLCGDVI